MTYLPYAGIGSRQTPDHILKIMRHIGAYLASEGWTLRSGAADGADTAFEVGVDDHLLTVPNMGGAHHQLQKEIYLPWAGFNHHPSILHPKHMPFSEEEAAISAGHHPAWDKCAPSVRLLLQRNLRQIIGHQSVCGTEVQTSKFVVCWTPDGQLKGGTAQALRIAAALSIPIINLGVANTPAELEALVLKVDELQAKFKGEAVNASQQA